MITLTNLNFNDITFKNTYFKWLSNDLQFYIIQHTAALLIQKIFIKNRPNSSEKALKIGDRVIYFTLDKRFYYGTIISIPASNTFKYKCKIQTLPFTPMFLHNSLKFSHPNNIINNVLPQINNFYYENINGAPDIPQELSKIFFKLYRSKSLYFYPKKTSLASNKNEITKVIKLKPWKTNRLNVDAFYLNSNIRMYLYLNDTNIINYINHLMSYSNWPVKGTFILNNSLNKSKSQKIKIFLRFIKYCPQNFDFYMFNNFLQNN